MRIFLSTITVLSLFIFPAISEATPTEILINNGEYSIVIAGKDGGDIFTSAQGTLKNRYIFPEKDDSRAGSTIHGHQAYDEITTFNPDTDKIDLPWCNGCLGPIYTTSFTNLASNTIYYLYLPSYQGFATIVCLSPCLRNSFWIPLENGKLQLTEQNFDLGL